MNKETGKQFRLGILILAGLILLAGAVYMIGIRQNLFGETLKLEAYFKNVNGLQSGNNVRFGGTDAGTVESVEVLNDTAIRVVILLEERYGKFIRVDAVASIGTDGLMGNKLINIINKPGSDAALVVDGSTIQSLQPVETDEMLRTLNETNTYVSDIALNLKNMTDRIGNNNSTIWKLLGDTVLSEVLDTTFRNFRQASKNIAVLSSELGQVVRDVNNSKGLFGTIMHDTLMADQLKNVMLALTQSGDQINAFSTELAKLSAELGQGAGPLGAMLSDSTMTDELRTSITNLKTSSEALVETLEALKKSPLLKKYFEEPKKKK